MCRRPGCGKALVPIAEFPIAWCVRRAERIKAELAALLRDQGDVGDLSNARGPDAETETASSRCAEHLLPFQAAEASTYRSVCSRCLEAAEGKVTVQSFDDAMAALDADAAAISAELTRHKSKLADPALVPGEFCESIAKWGAQETARIRAWEEREVKLVRSVAEETVQLLEGVCARQIEVGASIFTLRAGLRASLEELDYAVSDLPSDPAARLRKKWEVHAARALRADCEQQNRNPLAVGGP